MPLLSNVMIYSNTAFALAFLALAANPARAGDWTNSALYNGYGAASQNQSSSYSMRDANGVHLARVRLR